MNRNELTDMILDTKRSLAFYEVITTMCFNCSKFSDAEKACKEHGPIPPEYLTMQNDCSDWDFDDIPF